MPFNISKLIKYKFKLFWWARVLCLMPRESGESNGLAWRHVESIRCIKVYQGRIVSPKVGSVFRGLKSDSCFIYC